MMADARSPSFETSPVWDGIRHCILKVRPSHAGTVFSPHSRFAEYGFSSLEMVTIIFAIEEMFCISIIDSGMDSFQTCGELEAIVRRLTAA